MSPPKDGGKLLLWVSGAWVVLDCAAAKFMRSSPGGK